MAEKKRLFLIDGMSNIFRAYYAIRGLTNSKGMATNAIYGFTVTLRKLIAERKPDYLGVVLDSKEPTFRQEQFAAYKAHRPPMPEDLVAQLPYIDRVCEALRIPVLRMPRYEADDIIGTLARKASAVGLQTVILTNDKDLAQLVHDPDIVMIRIEKNGESLLDEAGVRAKYGVRADQIVDWLGLMGDTADGIPGAPGIGEKGAVGLLEQFGSIEAALRAQPDLLGLYAKHTGLYVYRREFLLRYARLAPTPLESQELLEQLRALEHGGRIRVVRVAHRSIGVDTPEDFERVRALLSAPAD